MKNYSTKEIINYQQSSRKSKLLFTTKFDGQSYSTSSHSFLDKLCKFFDTIGANMFNKIDRTTTHQIKIHSKCFLQSFVIQEISEDEVIGASLINVKVHTARLDLIPTKFIKIATCLFTPILTKLFLTNGGTRNFAGWF